MKNIVILLSFLLPFASVGERAMPIQDGKLITPLNANSQSITNLPSIKFTNGTEFDGTVPPSGVGTNEFIQATNGLQQAILIESNRTTVIEGRTNEWNSAYAQSQTNKTHISALSNDVDVVKVNVSALSNGLVLANANIANNSNRLVSVEGRTNLWNAAWQNPASAANWTWTSDGKEITLTSYNFTSLDVVIPDMLDGLPVIGFGTIFSPEYAGSAVTSISGGNNITTIGESAFGDCTALTSVSLPNATTIGYLAFQGCTALTSVSLPNATTIGYWAFQGCTALTSVSLPNATTIGDLAFQGCTALTSVSLPNATTVGDSAFGYCTALTSVSLPNATTVGDSAFGYCTALTSVSLPNATTIGDGAFGDCTVLTSVTFAQNAPAEATDVYTGSPGVTNYVTNPTATGWGATWNGMPVVRLPVYSDFYNGNGAGLTNLTGYATTASLSVPYTPFTSTITPANGTATVVYAHGNMPSLTLTAPAVLTLDPASYGTSGVSRVSLSLYCGTNTVTLATNVITYATTPTLSTNTWNTILIRRVSNDSWKGVQL